MRVRARLARADAVHTSRLLSLWVGTLPFVLVGCFTGYRRLLTMPLTAMVAWALFSTEELGHIIEEPFGNLCEGANAQTEVLPLDRYCESLHADLDECLLVRKRALRSIAETQRSLEEEPADRDSASPSDGASEPEPIETLERSELRGVFEATATVEPSEVEHARHAEAGETLDAEAAGGEVGGDAGGDGQAAAGADESGGVSGKVVSTSPAEAPDYF